MFRMSVLGRTSPFRGEGGKVRIRRNLVIAGRSGEGPLTDPTRPFDVDSETAHASLKSLG